VLYTQYIEDLLLHRATLKSRIRFHNAGVGGDRAKDALNRFDEDVAAYKPKYVTILLGMNDGALL
jgi:lysophospholipase L1-like esterase